jgi:putative oxidoreductase
MSHPNRFTPFAGRILVGAPFVMSGLGKLTHFNGTVNQIAAAGLPLPQLGWLISVLIECGCGALLIAGYRGRTIALIMAIFTMATAVFFHNNFADQNQLINFLKNLMIVGGLLQIAYFGAGPLSLDARKHARPALA